MIQQGAFHKQMYHAIFDLGTMEMESMKSERGHIYDAEYDSLKYAIIVYMLFRESRKNCNVLE